MKCAVICKITLDRGGECVKVGVIEGKPDEGIIMWLITYQNKTCSGEEKFYQYVFGSTCPGTSYIASYLKHAGLAKGESWDILVLAQDLVDGKEVAMVDGNVYSLWEDTYLGVLPMY